MTFRFLVIGGWNTLFGYGIFAALYLCFDEHANYLLIAVISHILAVTQSFISQRFLVFCAKGVLLTEYIRFHIANIGILCIGLIALSLGIEILRLSPLVAQALVIACTVLVSFFLHRFFTFRS